MDKDDKSPGSGGLITIVLLAAGAIFIAKPQLDSSRPVQSEPQTQWRGVSQDVDARLWQDPFSAVAKGREARLRHPTPPQDKDRHTEAGFAASLAQLAKDGKQAGAVVLAVMLPGGPFAEQVESRRRTRYAVLAGLSARGFFPSDNEHLGYFDTAPANDSVGAAETIVYEAFEPGPDLRDRGDDCNNCRLVVLWIDSSGYYDRPLWRLASLARRLAPAEASSEGAPPARVRWRVLGPSSSDGLRKVVQEASDDGFDTKMLAAHDLRMFSPAATAPDATLLRGVSAKGGNSVSAFLDSRGVSLLRTIGTDDALAHALVHELELRGLRARPTSGLTVKCPQQGDDRRADVSPKDLPSSIAIVSEWDTLYGRSLRQQFRYDPATDKPGFCVTRWHYLRGLDGRVPGDATASTSDAQAKKEKSVQNEPSWREGVHIERPEGQSQYDYLRRLASDIREEDARLRRLYGRAYGIRAIGVLGNDVYDKLLILQALQTELPHAIFFTTDLDARMFHAREQAWARNLIVASNFGLRLSEPLQRGYAPFRDSYQASAYLSTLLALADVGQAIDKGMKRDAERDPMSRSRWQQAQLNAWFELPRVFETSRTGAFDFSDTALAGSAVSRPDGGEHCGRWRLEQCAAIHPAGSKMAAPSSRSERFLIAALLFNALWVPALLVGRGMRRRMRRFVAAGGDASHGRRLAMLWSALATLAVVPPLLLAWAWPEFADAMTRNGKPLSISQGISPWPTYAIRLFTLVLCLYFVARAWLSLSDNLDKIANRFRLGHTRRVLQSHLHDDESKRPLWQRLAAMLSVRFYRQRPPLPDAVAGMGDASINFWTHYIVQNGARARLLRTALCVILLSVLGWLIDRAMGEAPVAPQRGPLTGAMQLWSTLPAAVAVQFLIFFVVDATVLSVLFVRGLSLHHTRWPTRTRELFEQQTGIPAQYLDDWIDLQFIARRTRSIGALIYYPFIVLSLMLLASSAFFDDWYNPPSLTVLAAISYTIVLGCAFALRQTAERSRRHAIDRVRDATLRAHGADNSNLADQLDLLRERMVQLRMGAFAPYSQQPLLKAVLLPVLTVSGSSLFDYLSLMNL